MRAATGAFVGYLGTWTTFMTALVYVGLPKLQRQPRPWSVVVPTLVLSAIPFVVIPPIWELDSIFYLPAGAFAVAGVVTGFEWRVGAL